jgi:hypothetical protein
MPKFLLIYRGSVEAEQKQPSPEEMQHILAAWGVWFGTVGPALVDGGDGLLPSGKIVKPGAVVTDGPFIEAKEMVGGYSIINVDSYEQAVALAQSCPIIANHGTIEIREMAGFN